MTISALNFFLWLFCPLLVQQRSGWNEIQSTLTAVLKLKLITENADVTERKPELKS